MEGVAEVKVHANTGTSSGNYGLRLFVDLPFKGKHLYSKGREQDTHVSGPWRQAE